MSILEVCSAWGIRESWKGGMKMTYVFNHPILRINV